MPNGSYQQQPHSSQPLSPSPVPPQSTQEPPPLSPSLTHQYKDHHYQPPTQRSSSTSSSHYYSANSNNYQQQQQQHHYQPPQQHHHHQQQQQQQQQPHHQSKQPREMSDVLRDRQEEEERYRRTRGVPHEIIRKVQVHLDTDGDFVTLFENFQKRYALCVVVKNHLRMGWKECQAVNDVMKIASRGTQIDNDSFMRLVEQLKTKYGKVQDPNIQNGRLTAVVFPGQGTIRSEKKHTIIYSSMSFDKDGDLVFSAHTNEDKVYRVCLELTLQDNRLLNLDCKAFIDILTMLETGDRLTPQQFFACGGVLRKKYNFVTPSTSNSGHTRCMTVLASRVVNSKPVPHVFTQALQDVQDDQGVNVNHTNANDINRPTNQNNTNASNHTSYYSANNQNLNNTSDGYNNHNHNNNNNNNGHQNQNQNQNQNHSQNQPMNCPRSPYPGLEYTSAVKEGGQGQVYAAIRTSDNEPVAVKVFLDQEGATEAYKTELRNLLKMSLHPNLVEVLDFFETPAPALVMRLIDGVDLMDYLRLNGAQSEEEGRRFAVGIAEGLFHLHRHGIIHRDFKSANILRQKDGTPVIIDLGLGSILDIAKRKTRTPRAGPRMGAHHQNNTSFDDNFSNQSASSLLEDDAMNTIRQSISHIMQRTSTIRGSFPWMAPEMITAQEWSEKTDVYAFGIIMWEIFSGQTPFVQPGEDVNPVTLLLRIANGERPDASAVSHISKELRSLMEACWNGDPRRRPSMNRVMDVLHGNDPALLFKKFDNNGSGGLDFQEFVTFLHVYVPKRVDMDMMAPLFRAIDTDNSGEIGLDEFQKFWWEVEKTGLRNVVENSRRKNI